MRALAKKHDVVCLHIYDDYETNIPNLGIIELEEKENNFRKAYANFNIKVVAKFNEKDIQRLLKDPGIIRNKLKVNAAIYNANAILTIQENFGSFKEWLDFNHPMSKTEWVKLFKKTFLLSTLKFEVDGSNEIVVKFLFFIEL